MIKGMECHTNGLLLMIRQAQTSGCFNLTDAGDWCIACTSGGDDVSAT
jgi:hypothetical protein